MASGIYAQADLAATTNTTLLTTAANTGTYNVRFCNRNATAVTVRLAIAAAATPTGSEYIEYGSVIPAYGVLEDQALVIQAGKLIVAYSNAASVSVSVWGVE